MDIGAVTRPSRRSLTESGDPIFAPLVLNPLEIERRTVER